MLEAIMMSFPVRRFRAKNLRQLRTHCSTRPIQCQQTERLPTSVDIIGALKWLMEETDVPRSTIDKMRKNDSTRLASGRKIAVALGVSIPEYAAKCQTHIIAFRRISTLHRKRRPNCHPPFGNANRLRQQGAGGWIDDKQRTCKASLIPTERGRRYAA
ncbi:MAG: hypothetical protein LBN05_04545 [Oscillospiraceae bacterium]|jgi:hypothetical protein|nr:hypothetical protein [Oscillospiraceae bacterium]